MKNQLAQTGDHLKQQNETCLGLRQRVGILEQELAEQVATNEQNRNSAANQQLELKQALYAQKQEHDIQNERTRVAHTQLEDVIRVLRQGKHEAEEANIAATKLCDETKKILEESQLDVAKMKIEVLALERAKKTISEELENLQRENQFMEEAHRGQLAIIRSKRSLEKQVASLELQVVNPSVIIFSDYCYFYFY